MQTTNAAYRTRHDYLAGATPSLLEALAEGMHTMAQPLTVLRATLEVAAGNASCVSHYQHAIDTSLVEISRVAEAMGFVQELVRIARDVPEPAPVELGTVIALVHEDLKCVLDKCGVSLESRVADDLPMVLAPPARLRQCLFYLVQQALAASRAGDTIHVGASSTRDQATIVVGDGKPRTPSFRPSAMRPIHLGGVVQSMALAEALAIGHGGSLQWQADPFVGRLYVPVASEYSVPQESNGANS